MTVEPNTPGITSELFEPVERNPESDLDLGDPEAADPAWPDADVEKPLPDTQKDDEETPFLDPIEPGRPTIVHEDSDLITPAPLHDMSLNGPLVGAVAPDSIVYRRGIPQGFGLS